MKKIYVKVKPGAKVQKITVETDLMGNEIYLVALKNLPIEGKANKELIKALAKYLKVKNAQVVIKLGHTSRNKVILINKI